MLEVIPRSAWGPRHQDGFGPAPLPAKECWLHHSGGGMPRAAASFDEDVAAILDVEQTGEDRFGGGISYTWLVTPSGRVFQGHGVGREGAHTLGHNTVGRAICLTGNYEQVAPTAAQLAAVAWLLQHAHATGVLAQPRFNGGHRDLKDTLCPGLRAYQLIPKLNELAAGPPITEETDMELTELLDFRPASGPDLAPRNLWDSASQILHNLHQIATRMDVLAGELQADEARVLGAIRDLRDAQLGKDELTDALADALVPLLPAPADAERLAKAVTERASQAPG